MTCLVDSDSGFETGPAGITVAEPVIRSEADTDARSWKGGGLVPDGMCEENGAADVSSGPIEGGACTCEWWGLCDGIGGGER